jgi:hypothetical protein
MKTHCLLTPVNSQLFRSIDLCRLFDSVNRLSLRLEGYNEIAKSAVPVYWILKIG